MKVRELGKAMFRELPYLLEMQRHSFENFLQKDVPPEKRKHQGLQAAFKDVFPIQSPDESVRLEFIRYEVGQPKLTPEVARMRSLTYAVPITAYLRVVHKDKKTGKIKEAAEQGVYMCSIPLMLDNGSFIFNGDERVVVMQLHRSPGIVFEEDEERKISSYGKKLFFGRIIPYRGSWIELEYDINNTLWVRIDKKRKFPITMLLRACCPQLDTDRDFIRLFYKTEEHQLSENLIGTFTAEPVISPKTGEILLEVNYEIKEDVYKKFLAHDVKKVKIFRLDPQTYDITIRNTLMIDRIKSRKEAINIVYRLLRGQEILAKGQAETFIENLFFKTKKRYDLTYIGRARILKKLYLLFKYLADKKDFNFKIPSGDTKVLTPEDIIVTTAYIIMLNNNIQEFEYNGKKMPVAIDDIDHLGNRRVRGVGELLENQVRIALVTMARYIRDKLTTTDPQDIIPKKLINPALLIGSIKKFFGTSPLSQFLDQTNPLAELTHKRRLSALGPGGLHRKRASAEVRDVHFTHYGRICPIETPEGANIGLITSLTCYAKINELGLITSPYRRVKDGKVHETIEYLTADRESEVTIAQASTNIENNYIVDNKVAVRQAGDYTYTSPKKVNYLDCSPLQVFSPSTCLIPFLEHDDANRALMGSNMQRQAVPLFLPEKPIVATGIEKNITRDIGAVISAERDGEVIYVDSSIIAIEAEEDGEVDIYKLRKYERSNQNTCINYIPKVSLSQKVKKNDVIADGPATDDGQLALGRNILVAFMPWEGTNLEDAILVSENLVRQDLFSSIHIASYEIEARETKQGPEEITREIQNAQPEELKNLDKYGIILPGTEVSPGDILVGKVTPKVEEAMTSADKLIKVIFGSKSDNTVDNSLRLPPGARGKVIGVQVFVRRQTKMNKAEIEAKVKEITQAYNNKIEELETQQKTQLKSAKNENEREKIKKLYKNLKLLAFTEFEQEKKNYDLDTELVVTVNKFVRVYVATFAKIEAGDKLSGRHGNKGVVAKILPIEDMPYMPDGTPIDVVFSPLCVPSRMNLGQLMETMLGWAGKVLNQQMIVPIFSNLGVDKIKKIVKEAKEKLLKDGVPEKYLPTDDCRFTLYDGRTGEPFHSSVTCGYMYLSKLVHMVADKIHARAVGTYSLVTRQPMGGKAKFGGQRFGEMEVWALEGYGAAHTLQEFFTIKSDDVKGRREMYKALIKGQIYSYPGVPESFKVLIKELQALGLKIELLKSKPREISPERELESPKKIKESA